MACYDRCAHRAASGCTPRTTSAVSAACRFISARGLSAAEAARATLGEDQASAARADTKAVERRTGPIDEPGALARAMDEMDEPAAQAALDRLLADFTVETVLRDAVLPYLHAVGERWERGEAIVAQEHFASNLLRGRLANLARGWGNGHGPTALLACPPGEEHDIPLLAFGIVLHRNGWRISYLGANTPLEDLTRTAAELQPELDRARRRYSRAVQR